LIELRQCNLGESRHHLVGEIRPVDDVPQDQLGAAPGDDTIPGSEDRRLALKTYVENPVKDFPGPFIGLLCRFCVEAHLWPLHFVVELVLGRDLIDVEVTDHIICRVAYGDVLPRGGGRNRHRGSLLARR